MRSTSISSTSTSRLQLDDRALGWGGSLAWPILFCSVVLALIGAATIHSASSELSTDYLPRQLVWIGIGLVAFAAGLLIDYRWLIRVATWLFLGGLLAVLLVTLFGHEAGGARSWIGLFGLGGQPSDFMKIATALLLARYVASIKQPLLSVREIGWAFFIVLVPITLVALQPDLGGAVMFLPILGGILLVAGVRLRLVAVAILIVVIASGSLWAFGMRDYQKDRILSFVQPERDPLGAGYQLRQSKIAVGSGQIVGKGFMQGTQSQLRFLPARHTDFIFAVLAEERGFVGVLVVLLLYVAYFRNGVLAALRARDRGGLLLVSGLLAVMAAYVIYNTAMMIGLLPVTGIPLPFLSYGGSFTLFCFFSSGLIAGVDRRRYVNR